MATAQISFLGNRQLAFDAGFSLFGTLCVICALSFLFIAFFSAVQVRHDFLLRDSAPFYRDLSKKNAELSEQLQSAGYSARDAEADDAAD